MSHVLLTVMIISNTCCSCEKPNFLFCSNQDAIYFYKTTFHLSIAYVSIQ
jgi:hypothetical protein